MSVGEGKTCTAEVKGRQCRSPRIKGDDRCYFHSEKMSERRTAAQKRGARVSALSRIAVASELPEDMRTVKDLMTAVEVLIREVVADRLDPRRASVLTNLVKLQAQLVVDHDLEDRVARLEDAA